MKKLIAIGTKADGTTVEFELQDGVLNCSNNNLTSLIIPKGCREVSCYNNNLTSLIIPEGCTYVNCSHNNLTSLIIPEGCTYVSCDLIAPQQLTGDLTGNIEMIVE